MDTKDKMCHGGVPKCMRVLIQLRIQIIILLDFSRINLNSIISLICNKVILYSNLMLSIWACNKWRWARIPRSKRLSLLARKILLAFRPQRPKLSLVVVEARLIWILYVALNSFRTTLNNRMKMLFMHQFNKPSLLLKAVIQKTMRLLQLSKISNQYNNLHHDRMILLLSEAQAKSFQTLMKSQDNREAQRQ